MDTIKVDMENLSEEERAQLLKLIEKSNQPKNKVWKPEQKELYYYIDSMYGVASDEVSSSGTWRFIDDDRYSIGNCFKTKEEAEFAVEKLKVIAELKRFAEENNERKIEWPGDSEDGNVSIFYNCCTGKIDTYGWSYGLYDLTYFSSHKVANEAIRAIGVDRIKKYYFGIED